MSATFERLQAWYASHCDGDWEHGYGIEIGTLDNPGWRVKVDLTDTELETEAFEKYEDRYEDEVHWLRCWKEGPIFNAACGTTRLEDALRVFLDWAELGTTDAG
jgi:hypothetical protein